MGDQRFCPRIVEGELRYNQIGDGLVGIIHKKPAEGGISAVGGTGSIYTYYGPDEPKFATLTENFLKKDLGGVMPALDLADEPLPLWWTTDFINSSPPGTAEQDESGLWVSSIAHAWASPNALQPTARMTRQMPATQTFPLRTLPQQKSTVS